MIAHRLDTLLDFDGIAVLDRGALVEFGSPKELLDRADGYFSRLYNADRSKGGN
jgi:ABC-type multidrug transport system fused ATPase/permease subunit